MANHIRVQKVPHKKKDGTLSETTFDWVVKLRRRRGGTKVVGTFTTKRAAENTVREERESLVRLHLMNHPNDALFKKKHKILEAQNV